MTRTRRTGTTSTTSRTRTRRRRRTTRRRRAVRAPRASRRTSEGRVGSNTCMTLCARSDSPRLRERSKESARRAPRCQSWAGSERAGDASDAGKVTWPRAKSGTSTHSRHGSTALLQRRRAATCSERERLDEGARPSQGAAERERDEERRLGKVDERRGSSARARGARTARAARRETLAPP